MFCIAVYACAFQFTGIFYLFLFIKVTDIAPRVILVYVFTFTHILYLYLLVGHGGAFVELKPFDWRVAGLNPTLAAT